jgi:signal peptidase II
MAHDAQPGGGVTRVLWGPLGRLGLTTAAAVAVLDQALKLWLLFVFDLPSRGIVRLTPFLDLVMVWNRGISYGLFQQDGPLGQWALLAITAIAVALLWVWLVRSTSPMIAFSLGLIIGGAVGNAIDRAAYGAVADFVLLHLTTGNFSFKWYVFNLADAAIVAGVVGLLYDSLAGRRAAKQP